MTKREMWVKFLERWNEGVGPYEGDPMQGIVKNRVRECYERSRKAGENHIYYYHCCCPVLSPTCVYLPLCQYLQEQDKEAK